MKVIAKLVAVTSVLIAGWLCLPALHGQIAVKNQGYVPFSEEPINYRSENLTDPVALLQKRIDHGEVKLDYEPKHGYLKSVLEKLAIPIDSQTLVFSKTSFQYKKISPEAPRALYFNDDVYVGQVHDGLIQGRQSGQVRGQRDLAARVQDLGTPPGAAAADTTTLTLRS